MSDDAKMTGQTYLVLAAFAGAEKADEVLDYLQDFRAKGSTFHDEAVVISVDDNGKVSTHGGTTSKKGIVSGSIVGLLVGGLVGFPIVGALLGGVLGRHQSKPQLDDAEQNILQSILDTLQPNSSLIVTEVDDWQAQNIADSLQSYGATEILLGPAEEIAERMRDA